MDGGVRSEETQEQDLARWRGGDRVSSPGVTSERVLKWSIVLGVVLRLVLALAYPGEITDSDEYLQLGRNIWHHGIFTRFELPPDCDPSELRSDRSSCGLRATRC